MKDRIIAAFPTCIRNGCFEIETSGSFRVFDREEDCCFICTDDGPDSLSYWHIYNPKNKPLHFIAIDKCMMGEADGKRCDFAIFDQLTFCFVEIKVVSSYKKRSLRKTEAYEQLKATLQYFRSKVDFGTHKLEAYICLGSSQQSPKSNSTKMGRTKELYDLYQADLFETNTISFY